MYRRGSYSMCGGGEPLIVVEESGGIEEEDEDDASEDMSPRDNPYLLSPYRDMRKRSLPSTQVTTGITASQVRRLSEQGGETGRGPSPIEAAFLATLSSAPAPTPGGRRHSVVTISKVPKSTVLFGRNRRESFAAFSNFPQKLQRKDSSSSIVRSPSVSGSDYNLQLDIMDDIAEIKAARKAKLKMWQTDSQEKICEVVEGNSALRYHQKENRRYSDVTGMMVGPSVPAQRRRASELPSVAATTPKGPDAGIVCSNTDLIDMMSLTSSAQEINLIASDKSPDPAPPSTLAFSSAPVDRKRERLKSNRSNSFDVSLLPEVTEPGSKGVLQNNWFTRRHQPMADKSQPQPLAEEQAETEEACASSPPPPIEKQPTKSSGDPADVQEAKRRLLWDRPSGSVVDPQLIGSAIEVFLAKRGSDPPQPTSTQPTSADHQQQQPKPSKSWFSKNKQDEEDVTCENSICSTLKDLFVK